jgi:hypothetical protein
MAGALWWAMAVTGALWWALAVWLVHCGGPWLYGWCTVVGPGCMAGALGWALAEWLVHWGGPWL